MPRDPENSLRHVLKLDKAFVRLMMRDAAMWLPSRGPLHVQEAGAVVASGAFVTGCHERRVVSVRSAAVARRGNRRRDYWSSRPALTPGEGEGGMCAFVCASESCIVATTTTFTTTRSLQSVGNGRSQIGRHSLLEGHVLPY
ncbi:hypothetical protein E2C01_067024 [Portunus trituberculatus]|uniref:Uncharacterized protein n=1 Tax=Portunus trituberculatus TaxID=210409 RepID=A0A5B7HN24_PORTR|nr:hypothetical protein [Portunus trituberculatus]